MATNIVAVTNNVAVLCQGILGVGAWFYIFALDFTHPTTFDNFAIPFLIVIASSGVTSALWGCKSSVLIWFPAFGFSLPFWGGTIFACAGDFNLSRLLFWGGLSASVQFVGLVCTWLTRKWCVKYLGLQKKEGACANCGYSLDGQMEPVRCPECGKLPEPSNGV